MTSHINLSCGICYQNFDLTERSPRVLSSCGHTICTFCVRQLLTNGGAFCPVDRKPFPCPALDGLPYINYVLTKSIEENAAEVFCASHPREKAYLVCVNDKTRMCGRCGIMNIHKGHQIKEIEELEAAAEDRMKNFDNKKEYYGIMAKVINKTENDLLAVDEAFEKLQKVLENKRRDLKKEISEFTRSAEENLIDFKEISQFGEQRESLHQLKQDLRGNDLSAIDFNVLFSKSDDSKTLDLRKDRRMIEDQAQKAKAKIQDTLQKSEEAIQNLSLDFKISPKSNEINKSYLKPDLGSTGSGFRGPVRARPMTLKPSDNAPRHRRDSPGLLPIIRPR